MLLNRSQSTLSNKPDIEEIERVQRRFTKRLPGLKTYSYTTRLNQLKLPSLELRHLHIDLIVCYKINFDDFFQQNIAVTTKGHPFNDLKNIVTYNTPESPVLVNVL